ncbi:MAG: cation:proton antiporter [Candidatus Paceibacterota bacterium]
MDNVFLQISILLALTTVVAFFVRLLKQPLIIGYIIAGIIAGPLFFNIVHGGKEMYDAFAQFGVILLLFVIGLNLNLNHLKEIGRASFITGIGQIAFTIVFGSAILLWLDFSLWTSLFLAGAITFSSTIIIMKLLSEKKDTETVYGRHTIGLMIVQDLIAVAMIVALGLLRTGSSISGELALLALKVALLSIAVVLCSRYILPGFLRRISHSSEMLFLFTVAWCFGVASAFFAAGLSIEIGAIVAGVSLASSPFKLEIGSRIRALRDFFLVLFFIVLGTQMGMSPLSDIWLPSIVLSLFILIGNPLILYVLFRLLKFTRRNSFLAGLTAAQVSEFGFVLLYAGANLGFVSGRELSIFTMVALLTIFTSSYLILYNERIYRFLLPWFNLFGADRHRQAEKVSEMFDVWIVGYHRIGRYVAESLHEAGLKIAVVDYDPDATRRIHDKHISLFFGDASDLEFIENLPLAQAKLVVLTIPALDDQLTVLQHMRQSRSGTFIVANAYQYAEIKELYAAGADYVMMPHLVGGNWIAGVLKKGEWTMDAFTQLRDEQAEMLAPGSK